MKLYKTHHGPRGLTLHVCMVVAMSELHFLFEVLLAIFVLFQIPTFSLLLLAILFIIYFFLCSYLFFLLGGCCLLYRYHVTL